MKKSKFTETQIFQALKEHNDGGPAKAICGDLDIFQPACYNWKYGGRYGIL